MCSCNKKTLWTVVYANGSRSEPMARGAATTLRAKNPGSHVVKAT